MHPLILLRCQSWRQLRILRRSTVESLSRGFSRGGTASWEHQYTKLGDALVDVLQFAGFRLGKNKELYGFSPKSKHAWFGSVGPAWTSQTCPCCGAIWSKPDVSIANDSVTIAYKAAPDPDAATATATLKNGLYTISWPDSHKSRPLTESANKTAVQLLERYSTGNSQVRRRALTKLANVFKHRTLENYERFSCLRCGVVLHADKVGALNIARKAIFQLEVNTKEMTRDQRRDTWQKWYKANLEKRGWWNAAVEERLA